MRHSHTVQRRRTIQRSLRRLKHRIKRLATSYVSPLGWAVAALAVASLVAFVLLGWHELLAMAVVFAVMLAAAVILSMLRQFFLLVPLTLIMPLYYGLYGILYAGLAADFISTLVIILFVWKEAKRLDSRA